ncbi:hypothetical protein ACHAXS_004582 [Conticribra weissflogii]
MEKIEKANSQLQSAKAELLRDLDAQLDILDAKEKRLKERLSVLNDLKAKTFAENGNTDAHDDDLIEINSGGKIVAARRSTLTQLKDTRLEALFSGRWDEKLPRDRDGRIFFDINPTCFQAIVDYLNELAISTEDNPPEPLSVEDEFQNIMTNQLEFFGLMDKISSSCSMLPECSIIRYASESKCLQNWLKEDGYNCDSRLLYRYSRDGRCDEAFHQKCDNRGPTVTIIETVTGLVLGGFTNASWQIGSNLFDGHQHYLSANGSFLFVLSGNGTTSPFRMKLKQTIFGTNIGDAIYCDEAHGPTFGSRISGNDLCVKGGRVFVRFGRTYEVDPCGNFDDSILDIKEMEVFQVSWSPPNHPVNSENAKVTTTSMITGFTKNVNQAIKEKWNSLHDFETEITALENRIKSEKEFMTIMANTSPEDIITLNVSGTRMMIPRNTLTICKESTLASTFAKPQKVETQNRLMDEWNHDEVTAWMNNIKGIPESVVTIFDENQISGHELIALGKEGLMDFGITRKATIYVILNEIKKVESERHDPEILIEHSPYCFGKIIDYLRLEAAHVKGLLRAKPSRPIIRDSEKARFAKVVKYYFPGESFKFILG